jgi:poly(A) polymerase
MNLRDKIDERVFHLVGDSADEMGLTACVVGGYVRDLLLRRPSKDIDFVAEGSGIELARRVASKVGKGAHVSVFATYGTAQVRYGKTELEFVGARRESYNIDSRNPVVESGTLAEDLSRRDFTVNAMAISVNKDSFGEIIDPYDGMSDLYNKILRTPLDPDVTFSDDPLRMMRAVRFAAQLDFMIYPDTFDAIKRNAERIKIITKERINDELGKILRSPRPSIGFRLLDESGLLPLIFPELCALKGVESVENLGHKDNFNHTLQVLDNVAARSDKEWLRWAALLHDIGKPATKKFEPGRGWTFRNHNFIGEKMVPRIFRNMKLPLNEKMKYVAKLVGMHMQPQAVGEEQVTDRAIRRMSKEAGEDLEDLMILAEADITSKNKAKVQRILENFQYVRNRLAEVSSKDDWREWENPINGNMIMAMFSLERGNVEDGMVIGKLRDRIKDEIYCIPEKDNFDYAYDFLLQIAPEYGITLAPDIDKEQVRAMVKKRKTAQDKAGN